MHSNATQRRATKAKETSDDSPLPTTSNRTSKGKKVSQSKASLALQSALIVLSGALLLLLVLIFRQSQQYTYQLTTEDDRCWLKKAFLNGDFLVGSHRSLGDAQFPTQPNCRDGLIQLQNHGIHYLDLDLIWDPQRHEIVVAHPMEFQGTTDFYSPCAKLSLREVLKHLQTTMPHKFLVSLEPKADWERVNIHSNNNNNNNNILQEPLLVLEELLLVLHQAQLQSPQQECSLIIDANQVEPPEEPLLQQLSHYCSLMMPVRRSQGHDAQLALLPPQPQQPQRHHDYAYLCPTIEFHPTHPNFPNTIGYESLRMAQEQVPNSIYWIVDRLDDLERVALFRGYGLVSNRPLEIVRMMQDPLYNWCPN